MIGDFTAVRRFEFELRPLMLMQQGDGVDQGEILLVIAAGSGAFCLIKVRCWAQVVDDRQRLK